MYDITVVGTGYVGLVTGACFADFGNNVTCVDTDTSKIRSLNELEIPFYEPGLQDLVARNVQEGRLEFSSDLPAALQGTDVVFITVGTPPLPDGSADTSAIYAVAKTVAQNLNGYAVVVQKSTAPVGTARDLQSYMKRYAAKNASFDVASNPEFLREGSAIETFMRPDRVVIGAETKKSETVLRKIHDPLYLLETPIVVTTLETAELIKYASNVFLATKISFINEISNVCEAVGADVQTVARGIGMDRRIGPKFLHAGPGYGGSCFPKDTKALASLARQLGEKVGIVEAAIEANDHQMRRMVDKITAAAGKGKGKRVGILGLAFKPNTDDMREAPSIRIVQGLRRRGYSIRAFDPVAMPVALGMKEFRGIEFVDDADDVAEGADAVAIITEWNEFRTLDLRGLKRRMRKPVLCDLRNIYNRDEVERLGFTYVGVGKGTSDTRGARARKVLRRPKSSATRKRTPARSKA